MKHAVTFLLLAGPVSCLGIAPVPGRRLRAGGV